MKAIHIIECGGCRSGLSFPINYFTAFAHTHTIVLKRRFPSPANCKGSQEREGNGNGSSDFKDALSAMVDEQVQELLSRQENKILLDGLEKASLRVELAKRELAQIQKQQLAAKRFREHLNKLEGNALEIAECQREISEARALIEEAQRSLSEDEFMNNRDEERWESVKAACVSAIVGTFAGLPLCLSQVTSITQLILPLAINLISSALFGLTFRYALRRNLDDIQLKTGIAAAFGVTKGLATLDGGPHLELNAHSFLSHAQDGTFYVLENLFIFLCSAVVLDYGFKTRLLSPFPIDRSVK
ncbi:hypothetical protein L6164_019322 [Bauhinia variegata]|uniref:Uncharacterized protein n=1 Tax=Bauhinia variegata TaxID=167791 RepID=A0ACB9MR57_BAUVA|nr:hypothetical protein L6164_019322 [Bauhinia variegata]